MNDPSENPDVPAGGLRQRLTAGIFKLWAGSYDHPIFQRPIYRPIHARLLELIPTAERSVILDVGCGTGQLTADLVGRYQRARVTGIDLSESMLREAMRRGDTGSATFVHGSVYELPFADDSVDLVTCSVSYHWYLEPLRALGEIHRVLRPGGHFALATPAHRWLAVPLGSMRLINDAQLRSELGEAGFQIESFVPFRPLMRIVVSSRRRAP